MADPNSRTQIVVALIGVLGVLAAAVVSNWKQFFPNPPDPSVKNTYAPAPQPKPPFRPTPTRPGILGNDPDAVAVVSAVPAAETRLVQGQVVDFSVTVRYRLSSLDNAALVVGLVQYRNAINCDGAGDIPLAGHVMIAKGEGTVTVPVQWKVGVSKQVTLSGAVGYEAGFWSDYDARILFKEFPHLPGYCYPFG